MKFLGFKNLSKYIRNSDEKELRKKAFIRFQLESFLVPLIINVLYFITRIDDAEALKNSVINGITVFSILEIFIVSHILPVKNKEIRRIVMRANNELGKMISFFRENGINTSVENLKQAEIGKTEKIRGDLLSVGDSKVLKGIRESIKIKTLEGEIKTLRQYRAFILQDDKFKVEHDELFLEEDIDKRNTDVAVRSLAKPKQ